MAPKSLWSVAFLMILGFAAAPAHGDCPGCQYAPLYPIAEIIILDLPATFAFEVGGYLFERPVDFGRSLGLGAAGGALGFAGGSLVAFPLLRDAWGAMIFGGLFAGIPAGILIGQWWAIPPAAEGESSRLSAPGMRWTCLPLPGGGRVEWKYAF